jgi:hypothetical protein
MIISPMYESDIFLVVHIEEEGAGFEVIDKDKAKTIYLVGAWAEIFKAQCEIWKAQAPTTEEVDEVLSGFAVLAQNPLRLH